MTARLSRLDVKLRREAERYFRWRCRRGDWRLRGGCGVGADDAGLVDFDTGIMHGADSDLQGDALEQGEVDMNVEPLCLEAGKAASDGLEGLADRVVQTEGLMFPSSWPPRHCLIGYFD